MAAKTRKVAPAIALPALNKAQALAIKNMYQGEATPEQQKRGMDWIINDLCRLLNLSFDDDPYVTAFNEGKRCVGRHLTIVIREPLETLTKEKP